MAHIIVVGNEKGGSGKSTTSMHVATALCRMGYRVGALDLDLRQKSFSRYIENRKAYLARAGISLPSRSRSGSSPKQPTHRARRCQSASQSRVQFRAA